MGNHWQRPRAVDGFGSSGSTILAIKDRSEISIYCADIQPLETQDAPEESDIPFSPSPLPSNRENHFYNTIIETNYSELSYYFFKKLEEENIEEN